MMLVSFDFDLTLCLAQNRLNEDVAAVLRAHAAEGHRVVIVTSRNPRHERGDWIKKHEPWRTSVKDFVAKHELPVRRIYFTNHRLKGPKLVDLGADLHYDNDPAEIRSCFECGVVAVLVKQGRA